MTVGSFMKGACTYRELDSQVTENMKAMGERVGKQVGDSRCNKTLCLPQVT